MHSVKYVWIYYETETNILHEVCFSVPPGVLHPFVDGDPTLSSNNCIANFVLRKPDNYGLFIQKLYKD
jgi:hypothetical protein